MDNSRYEVYIGKVLDSRYKILDIVGVGGMAFVLKAEDLLMNRIVAIKILNEEFNGDTQAEQRFINESKAVAMLSHKNIVNIYDVAIYPDMKYIVMEYLDGITLKEYLTNKGCLGWKEACYYIGQILRALEHAHSKGVIHRDIKPQNIMLLKNGDIKVTDFGIAKLPSSAPLTMTDKAIGTVYYISPEQASGKTTDFYSDLYSVGVMLYECTTGSLPFVATSPVTVAMMQINDQPKSPSEIKPELPVGLVQIILKAMEKAPENRFGSAHSMLRSIEQIVHDPDFVFVPGETVIDDPSDHNEQEENDKETLEPFAPELDSASTMAEDGKEVLTELPEGAIAVRRRRPRRRNEKGGVLPVIAGVTFAFILVAIVSGAIFALKLLNSYSSNTSDDTVIVDIPELIGKEYTDELEQQLLAQHIRIFKIDYVNNAEYGKNIIIYQSPEGKSNRKLSDSSQFVDMTLKVSLGKDSVVVPDVKFYEKRDAENLLTGLGLVVRQEYVTHDTILANYVVRTDIEPGTVLETGDEIRIYISTGQTVSNVNVPSLIGLTEQEAKEKLTLFHLSLGEITTVVTHDITLDGKVIDQTVPAGASRPEWSTSVGFTIAVYEPEDTSEWQPGSLPEESVPDESIPDESIPDASTPDVSLPETSQPEETQPDESQPEETGPAETQPDVSQPDESLTESPVSDTTQLQ